MVARWPQDDPKTRIHLYRKKQQVFSKEQARQPARQPASQPASAPEVPEADAPEAQPAQTALSKQTSAPEAPEADAPKAQPTQPAQPAQRSCSVGLSSANATLSRDAHQWAHPGRVMRPGTALGPFKPARHVHQGGHDGPNRRTQVNDDHLGSWNLACAESYCSCWKVNPEADGFRSEADDSKLACLRA